MDLERLLIFVDAAQTRKFSETAKRLHLTQPTVSRQIQALENELNTELFVRNGSGVILTPAGQALLPWAQQVLLEYRKFRDIAGSLNGKVSGKLRIACTTAAGRHILPQLALRFKQKFPEVQIQIPVMGFRDGVAAVQNQGVDITVISSEVSDEGLDIQPFFTDQIVLIVPPQHPWAASAVLELDELLTEPLIMREASSGTRRVLTAALASHDIAQEELNILLEIGSAEGIISAVRTGLGVAFISRAAAKCALDAGWVREVPLRGLNLSRQIFLIRNAASVPSRPANLFWGFIHDPENQDLY